MAVEKKPWAVSDDGQIEYRLLSPKYLNGALSVMTNVFFKQANVCRVIGLSEQPEAIKELEKFCCIIAKDGVTVVAIDKNTDKVIGVAFNKLKSIRDEKMQIEKLLANYKFSRSRELIKVVTEIEDKCDLFELTRTDCLMEIQYLSTIPECRGKGIALRLTEISIEIAEQLKNGNVKQSLDGSRLDLEPTPKLVSSLFTTFITQRIGKKLNFIKAFEDSYDNYEHNGRKFSDVIGKETPTFTIEYKRL